MYFFFGNLILFETSPQVQHLAHLVGQELVVQNLNIQSDTTDLLGGCLVYQILLFLLKVQIDSLHSTFFRPFFENNDASFYFLIYFFETTIGELSHIQVGSNPSTLVASPVHWWPRSCRCFSVRSTSTPI
jgi:hypothetical protein